MAKADKIENPEVKNDKVLEKTDKKSKKSSYSKKKR